MCSLFFVSISYWVFFSCVSFVFRFCDCVRLIWIWLGFRFWVIYVFVFGNSIVFASCSRLRLLIWNLGFLFVDHKSKFLGRILIFLEIKSRVWVLIKHYSCLVVSCFFRFQFHLCVLIFVSNLVRPHCKKKKGFTQSLPHRNVTLSRPSLQKKKKIWS